MLTRKQMERELVKRYGADSVWFIDWNYNNYFEELSNQEIIDLYNKSKGQFANYKFIVVKDLRRNHYNDTVLIVTKESFSNEVYYERQWDPKFNSKGFQDGFELNSYKDSGFIIRINEDTVIEKLDDVHYIQENYHTCPYGHVFE